MNITQFIKNRRFRPGKGVTEPPPEKGIKCFIFLLRTHFWKLVTLNLLFLAACIPIVTIPAALCGMSRVLILLYRDGVCFLWSDFIKEFKASLLKSLPFGFLAVFLLFDSYYAFSISAEADGRSVFAGAIGLFLLGFTVLFFSYVFVLLPSLDLKNRYIAKNAFILMATEWKTNFVILGSMLLMVFIMGAFFPYTIVLLLFIWFSFSQLIICTAVGEPLQRRIIGPYEQSEKKECDSSERRDAV